MSSNTAPSRQQGTNIKVPLISKIAYGMGDVGCNFSWMFVGALFCQKGIILM